MSEAAWGELWMHDYVLIGVTFAPIFSLIIAFLGPSFKIGPGDPKNSCTLSITCGLFQCMKLAEPVAGAGAVKSTAKKGSVAFADNGEHMSKGPFRARAASRMYMARSNTSYLPSTTSAALEV